MGIIIFYLVGLICYVVFSTFLIFRWGNPIDMPKDYLFVGVTSLVWPLVMLIAIPALISKVVDELF